MISLIICVIYHTSIETNSMIHVHNTRRSNNIHVNTISSLDKRNLNIIVSSTGIHVRNNYLCETVNLG